MAVSHEVQVGGGRVVVVHDTGGPDVRGHEGERGSGEHGSLALLWHHGSPATGALLPPVVEAAAVHGLRVLCAARPSYGGSSPLPGRSVADAAADLGPVLDACGVSRVVAVGSSGGGPHALACAALLPGRVESVVTFAGVAPYDGTDGWFAGMASPGALRAAVRGRAARAALAEEFDPAVFVEPDWEALAGPWGVLGQDASAADAYGPDGLVDDDVAYASPWGVALSSVRVPVLVVQGGRDRMIPPSHGQALAAGLPDAELWLRPDDGHVSILSALPEALTWALSHR